AAIDHVVGQAHGDFGIRALRSDGAIDEPATLGEFFLEEVADAHGTVRAAAAGDEANPLEIHVVPIIARLVNACGDAHRRARAPTPPAPPAPRPGPTTRHNARLEAGDFAK